MSCAEYNLPTVGSELGLWGRHDTTLEDVYNRGQHKPEKKKKDFITKPRLYNKHNYVSAVK